MKQLERVYSWLLLAPAFLPVVVWGGVMYPYLVPKTLIFYALSLAASGAFIILVAHDQAFFWSRLSKWEALVPGALLTVAYATSAFGLDFHRSFWSLLVRGDGLLMLTCAVVSFYLILLFADRAFFERLIRAVAFVASVVALYGIGEWFIGGGRIGSLLGNAAFFAGYLGISVFATLAAAQLLPKVWQRVVYVGAGLQVIAIILTATRGTILALLVALLISLLYLTVRASDKKRAWSASILGTLLVLGGLFFAWRSELARVPFEPIARMASISVTEGTVSSRLFVWKNMMTEVGKSPWLGVGAEHIDVLFNRFYDPTQIAEQWFDRSHNAFLDYLAQYGAGGLLLYLALIGAFVSAVFGFARRDSRSVAELFVLLAVTYTVQNLFVFDTISSFWLLLAFLATLLATSTDSVRKTFVLPLWGRYASWAVAVLFLVGIIPVSIRPALAAYNLSQAYKYQLVDVTKEAEYLSRGTALGTYADLEYGYEAYDMYANHQIAMLTGKAREDAYQVSLAILTTNFNHYTYDARTALYLAHVLSLAPQGVMVDGSLIRAALERAAQLSPKRSQPWYILTNIALNEANQYPIGSNERVQGYAAARDILNRYITLVPTLSAPHFVLAQLLYASGDAKGAAEEAAKGKAGYESSLEAAERAAAYYETVLDLPNAAYFLSEIVQLDPTNAAAKSDLEKIQAYEQSKK